MKLIVAGPTGEFEHNGGDHPEGQSRIAAAMAGIDDLRIGSDLELVEPLVVDQDQLTRVHDPSYLAELSAFCQAGGGDLDPDTYAAADSWAAACRAVGAGLAAVDALRKRRDGVAFVVARPPGHHALRDRAMGFCLLNNIAVSAAALAADGERVLIVDWDVHHGNGTQSIFWNDPDVLYVSTHQSPLFPGTGAAREIGGPGAVGGTVNVPLPAGATGDVVRRAIDEVALPVIDAFRPTWVLISAGFDAHRADPMAEFSLSGGDFAALARTVAAFAPRAGRIVLFLEGGYDLGALQLSVATTVGALMGSQYQPEAPTYDGPGHEMVTRAQIDREEALNFSWRLASQEERAP